MYESPTPSMGPEQRIHRQIICSLGVDTAAVAARVLALSRCGMSDPPLEHLPAPGGLDESALAQLALDAELVCDRIAGQQLAAQLQEHNFKLAAPDELQVWLLLGLAPAAHEASLAAAEYPAPAAIERFQGMLQRIAWQRLRTHIAWHVVLLLEAADQATLVTSVAAFRRSTAVHLYVMSPVDARHLRLAQPAWLEHVAHTITALLWLAPPPHSELGRTLTATTSLAAVAALTWCSPANHLHTALAYAAAVRILHVLDADLAFAQSPTAATTAPPAAHPAPSLQVDLAALRSRLPTLPAARTAPIYPSWSALATCGADIEAQAAAQQRAFITDAQQARAAWLDEAQTVWAGLLEDLTHDAAPEATSPPLGRQLASLWAVRRHLDGLAETVGDQLEGAGRHLSHAETAAAAARRKLAAVCATFPPCSPAGAVAALVQPWRWPSWALAYWRDLPDAMQRVTGARQDLLHWQCDESTWHTLRQHYLAAAQQTQAAINRLLRAHKHVQAALDLALPTAAAEAAAIPSPWSPARLTVLLQRLQAEAASPLLPVIITALLHTETTPASLLDRCVALFSAALSSVQQWSALDCLCAAFAAPPGSLDHDNVATWRWLNTQLQAIAPAWPAQELAEHAAGEDWWAIPLPRTALPWLSLSSTLVAHSSAHLPAAHRAHSALDAIVILRWSEVRVDLETSDLTKIQEED